MDIKEHVLGTAKADTLSAIFAGTYGVARIICIRPNLKSGNFVSPSQKGHQLFLFGNIGGGHGDFTNENLTGSSIKRNPFTFFDGYAFGGHFAFCHIDANFRSTNHTRHTKLTGNHGGVRCCTTFAGQNAFGSQHTMHIIGLGEGANHNNGLTFFVVHLFAGVCVKINLTDCGTGGSIDALAIETTVFLSCFNVFVSEVRMEHLVNLFRANTGQSCFLVNQAFHDHIVSNFYCGNSRALAITGLKHPEFAVFNRELDVLKIFVMVFELFGNVHELLVNGGHFFFEKRNLGSVANTGNNIFTLSIHQIIAKHNVFAGLGIAGESNTGTGIATHVAEDHGLNVDSSAEGIGDVFAAAIIDSAFGHPGIKYGFDSQFELFVRILGEIDAFLFANDFFVGFG